MKPRFNTAHEILCDKCGKYKTGKEIKECARSCTFCICKKCEEKKTMKRKDWIKKLKPYWAKYTKIEQEFHKQVDELENKMRKECRDENLELAYAKLMGGLELYFGIGFCRKNWNNKKGLIHGSELEI